MPRKPAKLKKTRSALLQCERYFLETGECTPKKGTWGDIGEPVFRTFSIAGPAGRGELKALWLRHREMIMVEWTGKGKPWAAKLFDGGKNATETE